MGKQEDLLEAILLELRKLNKKVENIEETVLPSIFNLLMEVKSKV